MLKSTFLHLKGTGRKTEEALWEAGISTWADYVAQFGEQMDMFSDSQSATIGNSFKSEISGNMGFFAKHLPNPEFYRIALTYPKDTIFLDIETTGLSFYYDTITLIGWSHGHKYFSLLKGDPIDLLQDSLNRAKAIVTFNGSLFDLKFLRHNYPNIKFPPVHIDLRFFSKRAGLAGGQKKIEEMIGFSRDVKIKDIKGAAAPILWQKYCRGDLNALKDLVIYNYYDVDGMRQIFDHVTQKIFKIKNVPAKIQTNSNFSKIKIKKFSINGKTASNINNLKLPVYKGGPLLKIKYNDLNDLIPLDNYTVIGIDLVSSEERETGVCTLRGKNTKTYRMKTDQEMLKLARDEKADLISIDSPLTIPIGRTTVFDDDPRRDEFGILRICERQMKKRGINSYPCLIPSMQKLTLRGMRLAKLFRQIGTPVIESYPGAAQDIMGIPRKQAGLPFLKSGLVDYGLVGEFITKDISHDELDAITSSIVGHFYWSGMCEGLGNLEEEYLFVPNLEADYASWLNRKIIGVSGRIGSGKTTFSKILESRGYVYARYSQVLKNMLKERKKEIDRSSLQEIGNEVNEGKGQRWLGKKLVEILGDSQYIVIDGLRFPEDTAFLSEAYGPTFVHVHIDTDSEVRMQRWTSRGNEDVPFNVADSNPVESQVEKLANLAHFVIKNNQDIESLNTTIASIIRGG